MKSKKLLSCILAMAMVLSLIVPMTVSVSASGAPTLDPDTGGWNLNHFIRYSSNGAIAESGDPVGVKIYLAETEREFFNPNGDTALSLYLPSNVTFNDIGFVEIKFNFPEGTNFEDMNNIVVATQQSLVSWEEHFIHAVPAEREASCNPNGNTGPRAVQNVVCGDNCAFDFSSGALTPTVRIPVRPHDLTEPIVSTNEYFQIIVIADWPASVGETPTAGNAKAQLLNRSGQPIRLELPCPTCGESDANCDCPCAECNSAKGQCRCCRSCGKFPCACPCPVCGGTPGVCGCDVKGDVNGDGLVNVSDALEILKHLAGITILTGETLERALFIEGETELSITHALEILKHIAGIRPNAIDG
jgi:hypothetical protein